MLARIRIRIAALIVAVFALLVAGPAPAVHLPDHRYTVLGEVSYEDGTKAANVPIDVTAEGGQHLSSFRTDGRGRYRFVLHVHNPDLGKVFDLRVGLQKRKVKIQFDPRDTKTERGVRLNFTIKRNPTEADRREAAARDARDLGWWGRIKSFFD